MIDKLELEELIEVINDYIRSNYEYDYADIFDDAIVYHYEDNKAIQVNIDLDKEED